MLRTIVPLGVLVVFFGTGKPGVAQIPGYTEIPEKYLSPKPSYRMAWQLARRVNFAGFADPKLTLFDAIDTLQKTYGLPLSINERAFKFEDLTDVLDQRVVRRPIPAMRNVPLAEVLRAVLARIPVPSGATFILRPDEIEITTRTFYHAEGNRGIRRRVRELATCLGDIRLFDNDLNVLQAAQLLGEICYLYHLMGVEAMAIVADAKTQPGK